MDVPAAAAGPWIALGAVLGILLVLATGAAVLRLRSPSTPTAPPRPAVPPRDDLADFLASPPGTRDVPADDDRDDTWAPLGPLPVVPAGTRTDPPPPPGSRPGTVLAGLAVVALLLVGVAAALAASARSPQPSPDATTGGSSAATPASPSGGRDEIAARLAFGGVVLEEHAVGITAAYPELELSADDAGGAVARLRLPTVNCLATSAPPEAGAPGCRTGRTEYAELAGPDLRVVRDGDQLSVSGRFPTYLRSPGAPVEWTGRSYDLSATVEATGEERAGWRTAEGELRWEDQRTTTRTDGTPSVLRPDA
ncbi:hypothetical protein [Blastococcus goldschmidtiae]|uniref:Uncharacterized protein n=1 Tax=Blastococcus goldschmidtiae TaxID=3075546 RepID=A0ABU2K4K6_9ACTN|nr:hypothetical protein [Blastococcus sp. DSM 46792]MDT0275138.1 hypothetical protein [Blastococcus sp. DSM 46792]